MKSIKIILALSGILAFNYATAQTVSHIKLSDDYPSAGEKITMTYDPAGTVIEGKKNIEASIFYLDNKDYPVADIDLEPTGKLLTGGFTVPADAKAFFIKLNSGEDVDNNNSKGYVYLVYKDKQPVEGAYAMKGYFLAGMGNRYAKIKPDPKEGNDLYKKEFELHPGIKKDYQKGYYALIATNPEYKTDVLEGIKTFEKSDDEKELMLAVYLLSMTKDGSADSLNTIVKSKFPNGSAVKKELEDVFNKEDDANKKDSIFNIYANKYPEVAGDKGTSLERFRFELAIAYLEKGNWDNYRKYESQLTDKTKLADILNGTAYDWAQNNMRLDDAEKVAKESVDLFAAAINNPVGAPYTSPGQAKKSNLVSYDNSADSYAFVLAKRGKFADALKYEQPVIDRSKGINNNVYENYITILGGLGEYAKVKEYAEKVIKNGDDGEIVVNELKKAFISLKGSESGFDQYLAPLKATAHTIQMANLARTMIKQPAPDFVLKDGDGNTVSLTGLKGKTVVVDFWATWCGPCKSSFPGMKIAVNRYKDDPDVKFLFVDTRETSANYIEEVKKFIAENKYPFHVIFDERDTDGKQRKVLANYNVPGIPTKFIIDKAGNIRFKTVGYFPGTPESLADDITDMITITANPEAYTSKKEGVK